MHEDVRWLLGIIVIFGLIWFVSGSAKKQNQSTTPLAPLNGGESNDVSNANGNAAENSAQLNTTEDVSKAIKNAGAEAARIKKELESLEAAQRVSPLQGKLAITNVRISSSDPGSEYLLLRASQNNTEKILISNLRLQSEVSGRGAVIKNGAYLPLQNSINIEQPIFLNPGDIAYIITGESPLGMSFRLNICTGFYTQYQNFNPGLPSQCPAPRNEPLPGYLSSNDQCLDYIYSLPGCRVISPPSTIPPECASFVREEFNYTKCVDKHRNDDNFYSPDWRVYLGRSEPLWKTRREIIDLLDQNGKIVDTLSY